MHVTPFHVAIIAQQAEVTYVMLKATHQFSKTPVESFKKLLEMKTKINFARGSPETYLKDDRTLDGINSFHLLLLKGHLIDHYQKNYRMH